MTLRTFGYAALIAVATTALVIGAAGTSRSERQEEDGRGSATEAGDVLVHAEQPVCATKSGMKNTLL